MPKLPEPIAALIAKYGGSITPIAAWNGVFLLSMGGEDIVIVHRQTGTGNAMRSAVKAAEEAEAIPAVVTIRGENDPEIVLSLDVFLALLNQAAKRGPGNSKPTKVSIMEPSPTSHPALTSSRARG